MLVSNSECPNNMYINQLSASLSICTFPLALRINLPILQLDQNWGCHLESMNYSINSKINSNANKSLKHVNRLIYNLPMNFPYTAQ